MKKIVSGVMLTLMLIGMVSLAFNIQQVESSEPPETEWSRLYGGADDDVAYSVVETEDGGYAIVGYTNSFGAGSYDFWLVKTEAAGKVQWSQTYGGTNDDRAYSVVQTSDGGYAIVGYTNSFGVEISDFWLVKTDAIGNMEWDKKYARSGGEFPSFDVAYSVVQTSDGGYAIAGLTSDYCGGVTEFWVVKTDSSGNMQWSRVYYMTDPRYEGSAQSVVETVDGGYAIVGYVWPLYIHKYDSWLVKTDSNGNMEWDRKYGGAGDDVAYSVVQTSDGGYAIAGYTQSFGAGSGDFCLIKTDSSGNIQWDKTYGGTHDDRPYSVVQTMDGGYAIAGYTDSFGAGMSDFWLVKTDAIGNMEWDKTNGGINSDAARAVVQTGNGGYVVAGYTSSFGAGSNDFWLVKIAPVQVDGIDFEISVTPPSQSVGISQSVEYEITVTSINDFESEVSLYVLASYADLDIDFYPSEVTPPPSGTIESTLKITTTGSTPLITFEIEIWATGGGITRNDYINLSVEISLEVPYQSQGDAKWCGPASLAMVFNYYGIVFHSWDYAYDNELSKNKGINGLNPLRDYVNGYYSNYPFYLTTVSSYYKDNQNTPIEIFQDIQNNIAQNHPVILQVESLDGQHHHAVVVTGFNETGVFVNDPSGALFLNDENYLKSCTQLHDCLIHVYAPWDQVSQFADESLTVIGQPDPLPLTMDVSSGNIDFYRQNKQFACIDLHKGLYWKPRKVRSHPSDTLFIGFYANNPIYMEQEVTVWVSIIGHIDESSYVTCYNEYIELMLDPYSHTWVTWDSILLGDHLIDSIQYYHIKVQLLDSEGDVIDWFTTPIPGELEPDSYIYYTTKETLAMLQESQQHLYLHAYDKLGNHIGLNYEIDQIEVQIVGALYFDDENGTTIIVIPEPMNLTLIVDATYAEEPVESYNLTVTLNNDLGFYRQSYLGTINKGKSQTFTTEVSEAGLQLYVWQYVFRDSKRGTELRINIDEKCFQLIAPDKTFSVKYDPDMFVHKHVIVICYNDTEIKLFATAVDSKIDFCVAYAKDMQTGKTYWLIDKPNRRGGCHCSFIR